MLLQSYGLYFLLLHLKTYQQNDTQSMLPKLINKNSNNITNKKFQKYKNIIKNYQKFIKKNFENVGEKFPEKIRSINYSDNKKEKGIYGIASRKDLEELREEGIDTQIIPWVEDKDN